MSSPPAETWEDALKRSVLSRTERAAASALLETDDKMQNRLMKYSAQPDRSPAELAAYIRSMCGWAFVPEGAASAGQPPHASVHKCRAKQYHDVG